MMDLVKNVTENLGSRPDKFYKGTLFHSENLLLGVNCLEPGQTQKPHEHDDQDKFYYLIAGSGRFWLGEKRVSASAGDVIWAPAGVLHGVTNEGEERLSLLVGIAPGS